MLYLEQLPIYIGRSEVFRDRNSIESMWGDGAKVDRRRGR